MQDFFYFPRWWMLVTRHWADNRRRYLLALLAITGLLAATYVLMLVTTDHSLIHQEEQYAVFMIGICVSGGIYASMLFSELSDKKKAVQFLTVPASQFEKLLCSIFFGGVVYFLIFSAIFYLVDIPATYVAWKRSMIYPRSYAFNPEWEIANIFRKDDGFMIPNIFIVFYSIQAFFTLGSIYFKNYAFLKSIISLLLVGLLTAWALNYVLSDRLPSGWHWSGPFEWSSWPDQNSVKRVVRNPEWLQNIVKVLLNFTLPFVCWAIAYVRLQEKEV